jgi:hypothetical protein
MDSRIVSHMPVARVRTGVRARAVAALGPLVSLGGVVWAFVQPERVTLLHPRGQSFWWLAIEPPLIVVAVGAFFAYAIARPLLTDLEADDAASG